MEHPHRRRLLAAGLAAAAAAIAACGPQGPEDAEDADTSEDPPPRSPLPEGLAAATVTFTDWAADPWARGSYSFMAAGASPEDRRTLAEPVENRWFLAGEATDDRFPSTVNGALASGRRAAAQVTDSVPAGTRVVVIGAGAAGLAAAAALRQTHEVLVVEARDRIGGRIHTDESTGRALDLGAAWIHGMGDNPLMDLAEELGVTTAETDLADRITVRHGRVLPEARAAELETALERIVEQVADAQGDAEDEASLGPVVQRLIDAEPDPELRALLRGETVALWEHEFAADLGALSLPWFDDGGEATGGDAILPDGYVSLLEPFTDGLEIRRSSPVTAIRRSPDGTSTVSTPTGVVEAGAVIITLPLGVLQAGDVVFDPPLPEEHLAAIDRLGMGVLDKVVVTLPDGVEPPDTTFLDYRGPDPTELPEWLNLHPVLGVPVLVGFVAGSASAAWAELPEEDRRHRALGVVATLLDAAG